MSVIDIPGYLVAGCVVQVAVLILLRCVCACGSADVTGCDDSVDGDGPRAGDGAIRMQREDERLGRGVDDQRGAN